MKFLIVFIGLITATGTQANDCKSNKALQARGFIVHGPSRFTSVTAPVLKRYSQEKANFVYDTEARGWNGEIHAPVLAISYDDLRTPQDLMFGDIFFIQNLNTKELYELRWFENGQKHVAYREFACATNYIPLAENALF